MKYSKLSYSITKQINKKEKKEGGVYFTPPDTVLRNIQLLSPYIDNIKTILEPSCGSGEFIDCVMEKFDNKQITGVEYNTFIFDCVKEKYRDSDIELLNKDYLKYDTDKKFDLIVGNPPFYVMKKQDLDKCYSKYFTGRPNIFIAFIIKSLGMLSDNGILSFILPKNFLNALYYEKTRRYIYENFKILHLLECNDKYIETQQETILLICQKVKKTKTMAIKNNKKYCLEKNDNVILGVPSSIKNIEKLYDGSQTLSELGCKVSVGTVVWNQCKDILTDDISKTRLIYSSDIKEGELVMKNYTNPFKKNFIDKKGFTRPLLVMNRGYGVGKYNFQYSLINTGGQEYLIENHLITITPYNIDNISDTELIELYNTIINSFNNDKTKEFMKLYFGNNAINTTEINYILPIYI